MTITDLYLVIRCMKSAKDENDKIDFDKFMEELEKWFVELDTFEQVGKGFMRKLKSMLPDETRGEEKII